MDRGVFLLSFGLAGIVTVASAAAGQHEGHQAGAAPSAAQVTECRQAQPVITQLLNAALRRLEDARLTNSAAAMRDAADDVQAALVDMRTQLAPCTVMQAAAAEAPASPATSTSRQPAAAPAQPPVSPQRATAPAAADSHAGHTAPAAAASRTPAATAGRSSTPARSGPPATDAHAGHTMPPASAPRAASTSGRPNAAPPPTNIAELKCSNAVDPRTAPRMLYQGRMYYFCTEASRAEFAKDPARVVTAPPQAAPAHAH
jgi:YHS domain-containing protein